MIQKLKSLIAKKSRKNNNLKKGVDISTEINLNLKKYDETYRLLEEYDKKSVKDPTELAEPGRLQDAINKLQRSTSSR